MQFRTTNSLYTVRGVDVTRESVVPSVEGHTLNYQTVQHFTLVAAALPVVKVGSVVNMRCVDGQLRTTPVVAIVKRAIVTRRHPS